MLIVLQWLFLLTVMLINCAENSAELNISEEFEKLLGKCHWNQTNFDPCMKSAVNDLRPFYKSGIPKYEIPPFDPFFIPKVSTSRGGTAVNFKLTLRNVYERGWTGSRVTAFKSNFPAKTIQYHQAFPEKYLDGEWEMLGSVITPLQNHGKFDLSLYNYTQVTTIHWTNPNETFKVRVTALECGDMKLHLTNLLGGRIYLEGFLDTIINRTWRPGFEVIKPVINDLVSTAFSRIFNEGLKQVPFSEIIPE